MASARRVTLALLAGELVLIVLSGVALLFLYEPTPAQFLGDTVPDNGVQASDALRVVHGWVSFLFVVTVVVGGVVLLVGRRAGERALPRLVWAAVTLVVAVAAVVTGLGLPYDQVAVSVVMVAGNRTGYVTWLTEDAVLFFLVDGAEVARSTLAKLLALHSVAIGGALIALVGVGWWRWGRRVARAAAPDPAGTTAGPAPDPVSG